MAHPVPSAKDALKALLVALPAYSAVDVRDGEPAKLDQVTTDMFWFNETTVPQDGWASLGAQRRRIMFQLGFTLVVFRDDVDATYERTTEDVIWGYFEALMGALKANSRLGGVIEQVQDVTGKQANDPLPEQWQARFDGQITCISNAY